MFKINKIMLADSYKYAQPQQYPIGTNKMFSYLETRSFSFNKETVFFGLQYYIKQYLEQPIEQWEIDEASSYASFHGEPFDKDGWQYILNIHNGFIPVKIKAVEEMSVIPNSNVLMTIESTDEKVFWVVGFLETLLLKVWYPCTIATKSLKVKKILEIYSKKTSDNEDVSFQFHNFGDRGSSSPETAMIGGMAHLTQFSGTDVFSAVKGIKEFYGIEKGWSIPGTEHSTVTSWTKEKRFDMYNSYIEKFKNYKMIACVMDSYDIFKDVKYITSGKFKEKIESNEYPHFVIRPDSGNPIDIMSRLLDIMEENSVKFKINNKGFKVFEKFSFIWGDGITIEVIEEILKEVVRKGYSSEIISFGSGGDLMQNVNRDTLGFAFKCSYVEIDGKGREVFKEPITDSSKKSKKGKITLFELEDKTIITAKENEYDSSFEKLKVVYIK